MQFDMRDLPLTAYGAPSSLHLTGFACDHCSNGRLSMLRSLYRGLDGGMWQVVSLSWQGRSREAGRGGVYLNGYCPVQAPCIMPLSMWGTAIAPVLRFIIPNVPVCGCPLSQ